MPLDLPNQDNLSYYIIGVLIAGVSFVGKYLFDSVKKQMADNKEKLDSFILELKESKERCLEDNRYLNKQIDSLRIELANLYKCLWEDAKNENSPTNTRNK